MSYAFELIGYALTMGGVVSAIIYLGTRRSAELLEADLNWATSPRAPAHE